MNRLLRTRSLRMTAVLLALSALIFASCGSEDPKPDGEQPGVAAENPGELPAGTPAEVSADAPTETPAAVPDLVSVRETIAEKLALEDYMPLDGDLIFNLYGIASEEYVQNGSFVTMAGIFPHEAVLLEAADEAAADRIAEMLENRLTEVMNQAANYDPENYALAQKCKVRREGLLVTLLLSPDAEAMQAVLDGMAGE